MADEQSRQDNLDSLLGNMAIRRGLLTQDQLRAALAEQGRDLRGGKSHPRPLGIILVTKGFLSDEQLLSLLEEQKVKTQELESSKKQDSLLGRILLQKGQITSQQLNECLGIQSAALDEGEEDVPRLGALLIKKGYSSPSSIMHALAVQQKTIMFCEACDLKFNVQNYNPSNPIFCPNCKSQLTPVPEAETSRKEGISVESHEIAPARKPTASSKPAATAAKTPPAQAHAAAPPPKPVAAAPASPPAAPVPDKISAEERARQEALRQDAEIRAKAENARKKAAEERAQAEAENKKREEGEARKKAEEEERARAEMSAKAHHEVAAKSQKKEDAEKARIEAIRLLAEKARRDAEAKSKVAEDKKSREQAELEAKQKAEAEQKAISAAAEEKKALEKKMAEAEAKQKAEAEAKQKAEAEAEQKAEAEAEQKAEAEKEAFPVSAANEAVHDESESSVGAEGKAGDEPQEPAESGNAPEDQDQAEARAKEEAEAMARAVEDRHRQKSESDDEADAHEPGRKPDKAVLPEQKTSVAPEMRALRATAPRKSKAGLVAAILGLLLLGGAGVGGYLYYQDIQSKKADLAAVIQQASAAMSSGKYLDALGAYERALAMDATNGEALAGKANARAKIDEEKKAAEDEKEKTRKDTEAQRKALEEKMAQEIQAAKDAEQKKLREAEAKALAEAEARRKAEEQAREAEARAKAQEEEARRKAEAEAKAKAEAEAARIAAEKAKMDAEAQAKLKAENERRAREEAEARAREAEKAVAEQTLVTAVLHADKGDFPAAYQELDKARKGGLDPVPVGRRIVQKELSALFASGDRDAKVRGYRDVLSKRSDYLTDALRDATLQQILQIDPPAGLVFIEKDAQGRLLLQNQKDESVLVYVPGGEFIMGADAGDENEKPSRKVHLDAFLIDRNEITVAQFRRFVEATRYVTDAERSGGADVWTSSTWETKPDASWKNPHYYQEDTHPVTCVSWNDVAEYCKWAGKRLPTEAEWEKAARGTDGRKFPWGNESWKADEAYRMNAGPGAKEEDGAATSAPVGTYPGGASPYGILDMAGNVAEWCSDWYDDGYYKKGVQRNPAGPATGSFRIRRGGSWFSEPERCRATARIWSPPVDRNSITGFRGARSVP